MKPINKTLFSLLAALAIAGGSYLGTIQLSHSTTARADTPADTAKPTVEPPHETVTPAVDLSRAFRAVHNSLKDAVVNIHISGKESITDRLPPGLQLPPGFNRGDDGDEPVEGLGSGVIVSPDGYVLTNNHVVEHADLIDITLNDGRKLKAKVIGTDPKTDLAVVKIEADHLTYAKFGDSDAIDVGDWVLAFGSPFGFDQTMTQGIISAKGRHIGIIGSHNKSIESMTYENFLQTDAAINPGNSGGPLVNLKGEVVGINAAIASNTGAYNGIGFSIPSNDAQYIMDSLIKHGKVIRGFLNVKIEDIHNPTSTDQALADSIIKSGFTGPGTLVGEVDPEGPAGKGGVKSGDVITALNDKPISSVEQFRNQIAHTAPNTDVKISLYRDGKNIDVSFPVGTQPDTLAQAGSISAGEGNLPDLGLKVSSVDRDLARKYRLRGAGAVVITELDPSSTAAKRGLNVGDLITTVNDAPVTSPEDLSAAIAKAKTGEDLKLTIRTQQGMDRLVFIPKN